MARRPSAGNISSVYGWRVHPITKQRSFHTGEDIGWLAGYTLVMPFSGRITAYANAGGYGQRVIISDGNGLVAWLAHTAALTARVGRWYDEGTPIAIMGATGNVTGVHLHWEIWWNGVRQDPAQWLAAVAALDIEVIADEQPIEEDEEMPRYIRNADTGTIAVGTLGVFHVELPGPAYVALLDGWGLWDRTKDLNLPGNIYDFVKSWAPTTPNIDAAPIVAAIVAAIEAGGDTISLGENELAAIADAVNDDAAARLLGK